MGLRISKGVSDNYAENIPKGTKSRAGKKVKKNKGNKERRVRPVFFEIEDREILA